jgi:ribosome-binding factor A
VNPATDRVSLSPPCHQIARKEGALCVLLFFFRMWHSTPFPSEAIPMSRRRQKADEFKNLAADSCPEDGGDPKEFHAKPWDAPKKAGRKAQQLCQQVKDALHVALAACADPAVLAASVLAVEPAPHTGRLRVILGAPLDVGREVVAAGVERAAGHLRAEVAASISRRHAPELVFEVIET